MAADDQISVELIAKIDQLTSGFSQAKSATNDIVDVLIAGFKLMSSSAGVATDTVAKDVHDMAEAVKHEEGLLHEVLSGALFLEFREIAKEAFEGVKEAFESTVVAAEEFGLANAKFAAIMHTSEEDAAGLSAALHGVGSSSEAYESIALRLQKTVQSGAAANKELTDQFKDQEGHVLTGTGLMERLKEVLGNYTEESQNAIVVQLGLGRRASDLYDVMRVGSEDIEHQKELYKAMGVNIAGTGETSKALEEKLNDLHTVWTANAIAIGQELMPVMTEAIGWMSGPGRGMIQAMGEAVKALVVSFEAAKVGIVSAVAVIAGALTELWDSLKAGGKLLYDVFSGNWGQIKSDMADTASEMKNDFRAVFDTIEQEAKEGAAVVDALYGKGKSQAEPNPFKPKSGKNTFTPAGKGGADKSQEEEIAAEEKLGLASIAIAEKTSSHLLAMGQQTVDAFVEQQRHLEDLKFKIQQEALDKELAVTGQTTLAKEKILDKMQELELAHQGKLLAIDQDGGSRRAQVAQKQLADFIRDSNERLSIAMAEVQRRFAAEDIGAVQAATQELAITNAVKQGELARLDSEMATLTKGTLAYEQAYRQRERVVKEYATEVKRIQDEETRAIVSDATKWSAPMTGAFNSSLNAMLSGAKSFEAGMKDMWNSMLLGFLSLCEQELEKWIILQIGKQVAAETADTASAVAQRAAAASQIPPLAAVAAAGAYSSQASIPYVGPYLAAAAAAEAFGYVMSLESVAAAAGGMTLDQDQLVFAHKREMILPAHLSVGLQSIIERGGGGPAGGGAGASGGDVNLHYSPTVHAPQSASLGQMLQTQSRDMLDWFRARQRDGSLSR